MLHTPDIRPNWRKLSIVELTDDEVDQISNGYLRRYIECERASGLAPSTFAARYLAGSAD
jgi:hypothetical protein